MSDTPQRRRPALRLGVLLAFATLGLSGCVAYPVGGAYGPGYVYAPAPPVVVGGAYYGGYYGGNYYRGGGGYRGWHRGWR